MALYSQDDSVYCKTATPSIWKCSNMPSSFSSFSRRSSRPDALYCTQHCTKRCTIDHTGECDDAEGDRLSLLLSPTLPPLVSPPALKLSLPPPPLPLSSLNLLSLSEIELNTDELRLISMKLALFRPLPPSLKFELDVNVEFEFANALEPLKSPLSSSPSDDVLVDRRCCECGWGWGGYACIRQCA